MRKEAVAGVIAILVVASLGVVFLATSTGTGTRTSSGISTAPATSSTTSTSFTYQTETSSTIFSSNSTAFSNGTTITRTFTSVSTSTFLATWVPGEPIPAAMVETDNFSMPAGPFVLNPTTDRIYILGISSLTIVDASSHSVVADVPFPENNTGGSVNAGLAVDASRDMVYVAVQGEVLEVNGSTNMIVRELPLSLGTLAFDTATGMLWGTQPYHESLVEVDVSTGFAVANVSLGFQPYDVAVDPSTGLVYSDGCSGSFVCDSEAAVVNGASGTLAVKVKLGSEYYPTMAFDPATHVLYVSGAQQLVAISGATGRVVFNVNPQTCGPFTDMVVDPSANLVYTSPENSNYLLAYNGSTGKPVNMYVFGNPIDQVALNPSTSELYVQTGGQTLGQAAGQLAALRPLSTSGNVNATLIGAGLTCLPV